MRKANFAKLVLIGLLVVLVVSLVIQARQQTNTQTPPQTPPSQGQNQQPPPEPKNLLVLKGMSGQQVNQVMRQWETETGAGCNYCHIRPFDQDTPRKNVARWMMTQYVTGLKHKDGSAVSCKDCHQGEITFLRSKPFVNAVGQDRKGLVALKGASHEALMAMMQSYTKALGVKCDYCHTADFGEDTPHKEVARYMITTFTNNLTKDGNPVTCNDCHQGRARVLSRLPRPGQPQQQRPQAAPETAPKKPIE